MDLVRPMRLMRPMGAMRLMRLMGAMAGCGARRGAARSDMMKPHSTGARPPWP
jgi:hypothetical protein